MSLDLDEIRSRGKITRDGFYHVVGAYYVVREADFDALAAEAVRLRTQVADYRVMIDGLDTAAHEERAAVVAWLRRKATDDFCALRVKEACDAEKSADAIERGEHRRKETP